MIHLLTYTDSNYALKNTACQEKEMTVFFGRSGDCHDNRVHYRGEKRNGDHYTV